MVVALRFAAVLASAGVMTMGRKPARDLSMNRTGLLIALAVAVAVGLLFGFYPELDLKLSALMYDQARGGFWARVDPALLWVRTLTSWLIALVAAPAVVAPIIKLILPRRRLLVPGRAVVLMLTTLVLAPGLLTNVLLKDEWGRPRPIDVRQFGGDEALMIQMNEMLRTLALIEARRRA